MACCLRRLRACVRACRRRRSVHKQWQKSVVSGLCGVLARERRPGDGCPGRGHWQLRGVDQLRAGRRCECPAADHVERAHRAVRHRLRARRLAAIRQRPTDCDCRCRALAAGLGPAGPGACHGGAGSAASGPIAVRIDRGRIAWLASVIGTGGVHGLGPAAAQFAVLPRRVDRRPTGDRRRTVRRSPPERCDVALVDCGANGVAGRKGHAKPRQATTGQRRPSHR